MSLVDHIRTHDIRTHNDRYRGSFEVGLDHDRGLAHRQHAHRGHRLGEVRNR